MAEALPPASTTRRGVNPSKFMGESFAAGSNLSDTVFNNSKKITHITEILKLRKENVGKNLKGEDINSENLAERLNNIAQTLAVLTRALKQQLITQKRSADVNKQNINEQKKKNREKDLEKQKEKQSGGGGAGRVVNAIKAPFTGIFDAAKKFFGSIVAGSSVLGLMKWLKEMDASQWEGMIKTLQDNAGLILKGILAVAAIPVLATVATFVLALVGAVAIFGPIIAVMGKALFWITTAVAAIAALWAAAKLAKKGVKWIRENLAGGEASLEGDIASRAELREAGVSQNRLDKLLGRYTIHTRKMDPMGKMRGYVHSVGYDQLTKQQKEAVDKHKEEIKRMNDLEKERDRKIEELNKSLWQGPEGGTWKYTEGFLRAPWNRRLTEAGKEKKKEIIKKTQLIHKSYEDKISSGGSVTPSATVGDKNVTQSKIDQPLREGSTSFLPLMGGTSSPFDSSGSEGGSSVPSFASDSGKVGNQFILGVVN